MARRKEQSSSGAPEWMTTYSDMVTLLLCFFIMLFAMSTVDKNTFTEIAASLANSFINLNAGTSILENSGNSVITVDFSRLRDDKGKIKEKYIESAEEMLVNAGKQITEQNIDAAKQDIKETIEDKGLSDKVQVTEEKEFLLVRLDSEIFFDSGSAEIRPEGKKLLTELAETLRGLENEIYVSGHTDNVPISNSKYSSNWELSTARATNVVKYLVDVGKLDPAKFTATGNGEFRPVGDNNTPEGRQQNRRIEIKIMK